MTHIILLLYCFMWYIFAGLVVLFTLLGLDDVFIDLYFWLRYQTSPQAKTKNINDIIDSNLTEKYIAVLIPCWQEASIIDQMLINNSFSIDYKHYYLFVGVYPNDPETMHVVRQLAVDHPHIQCVVGHTPGPTNKASNLNQIYHACKEFEKHLPSGFEIFVLHDSEDLIHPLSFKIYNQYMTHYDMVQIPIFPLEVPMWNFTHWLYADEFAENHTKNIIVRQAINAHVPSAGVGTAFSRRALRALEQGPSNHPFATDSLTEDYHTSLDLRIKGLKPTFVLHDIWRKKWVKSGLLGHQYRLKIIRDPIATRAFFPREYKKSVRQKARWIIGIVFQEWDHAHWSDEWTIRFTLSHDRKGFITHFINILSYIVFVFWILYSQLTFHNPIYPSLQEQLNFHPIIHTLMWVVLLIMAERYLQRMIATQRIYGWRPLVLLIPRAVYGNILNFHALLRAYRLYFTTPTTNNKAAQPSWDKTDHDFAGRHPLLMVKNQLGSLMVEKGYMSFEQLHELLHITERTHERLGEAACRLKYIDDDVLIELLAIQYETPRIDPKHCVPNASPIYQSLPRKIQRLLGKYSVHLVHVDEKNHQITIAIPDPTNTLLIRLLQNKMAPWTLLFCLYA